MKSPSKVIAIAAAFATVASLAACSAGGSDSGKIELRVATFPPGADQAAYDAFATQEAQFEKKYPDIDIIGVEYEWEGPTFTAQLAAGSLPDVFTVPFTDAKTLLENGQLIDVTKEVTDLGYADKFNPIILDAVKDADGNIFGFPRQAYALGSAVQPRPVRAGGSRPELARPPRGTRCASTRSRSPRRRARPATPR